MAYGRHYGGRRRGARRARINRRVRRRAMRRLRRFPRSVTTMSNIPRVQKLRYCQPILLQSVGGAQAKYQFRANSLFDPDYTSVGHQPLRFDQLSTFYGNYIVVGSKITVLQIGGSPAAVTYGILALYLSDSNSIPNVNEQLIENGKCKWTLTTDSSNMKVKLTEKFSAKKFFNITNIKDNESRIGAAIDANPADIAMFNLVLGPLDGASGISLRFLVTIDYLAIFQQPLDVPQS